MRVNLYDALGLDRGDSAAELSQRLERLRVGQATRARRGDAAGERARAQLALIDEAARVFADGDSKDRYDAKLRHDPPTGPVEINWMQRVESYYLQEDFGAADIAVRKVPDADREGPAVWVLSAWIQLAPLTRSPLFSAEPWAASFDRFQQANHFVKDGSRAALVAQVEQAKRHADEAFTLDPLGKSADVFHVRGVCFYFLQDFDRAISNYRSALDLTSEPAEAAELCLRIALAHEAGDSDAGLRNGLTACERGLGDGEALPVPLRDALRETWTRIVRTLCEREPLEQRVDAYVAMADRIANSEADALSRVALQDGLLDYARDHLAELLDEAPEGRAAQRFVTRWEQGLVRGEFLSEPIVRLLTLACQQNVVSECEKTPVAYRSEAYLAAAGRILASSIDAASRKALVANFRANSQRVVEYEEGLAAFRSAADTHKGMVGEIEQLTRDAEGISTRLTELAVCRAALEAQEARVRSFRTTSIWRSVMVSLVCAVALLIGVWMASTGLPVGDSGKVGFGLALAAASVVLAVILLLAFQGRLASGERRALQRRQQTERKRMSELRAALRDLAISSEDEARLKSELSGYRKQIAALEAKRAEGPGDVPSLTSPVPCVLPEEVGAARA